MSGKTATLAAIMLCGWIQGCDYSGLGQPSPQFTQPQAYQAYLKPVKVSDTTVLHDLMIRNRRDGTERVVDRLFVAGFGPPPLLPGQTYDRTPGRVRVVTYGTFSTAGSTLFEATGQTPTAVGLTAAQARRLYYIRIPDGELFFDGAPIFELKLDDVTAPIRQVTALTQYCSIRNPTYDFANIEASQIQAAHRLPGLLCGTSATEELRNFQFGADEAAVPGNLGQSFLRAAVTLNDDGRATELLGFRFVREGMPGRTENVHELLVSCPLDSLDVERDCRLVRGVSPSRGEVLGDSSPQDIRAQTGPGYRLQNGFFRIGRRLGQLQSPDGLFLYRSGRSAPQDFQLVHDFATDIRPIPGEPGDSFPEFNTNLFRSAAVLEREDQPDLLFFADGDRVYRVEVNPDDVTAETPELIYSAPPVNDPSTTLQRIREVRVVGGHVVFLEIAGSRDPAVAGGRPTDLRLYALPIDAPAAERQAPRLLDRIEQGGVFRFRLLTSRNWSYTRELGGRSQARLIISDPTADSPDMEIRSVCMTGGADCDLPGFDGSKWLFGSQSGTSSANVDRAGGLLTLRLGANVQNDQSVTESFVVYLHTDEDPGRNPRRDTELWALDVARPLEAQMDEDRRAGRLLGSLPGRTDPLDEVGCGGALPAGGGTPMAGATFGEISGYGREALLEIRVERFSRGDDRVRFDTDIYAVDLGAVSPSLTPVSTTPTLPLRDPQGRCLEPDVFLIPLNDDLVADVPNLAADRL